MSSVLSNSKIKTWGSCHRQYWYKYVEGWKPKAKALPLERGSWIHELLMAYYDGEDWHKRHDELTAKFNRLFVEQRDELGDLPSECERIMRAYVRQYKDDDWKVVETELDETLTLPNGLKFRFIIDLIVEEQGHLWLVDHKTVKSFMDQDTLIIDSQLARYTWCAEYLGYKPIQGVIFNEVRTKAPAIPAQLKSGLLTQKQNQDTDVATYLGEIKRLNQDPKLYRGTLRRIKARQEDRFFKRTRLPKDKPITHQLMGELVDVAREMRYAETEYKETNGRHGYPRHTSRGCTWCSFLGPCQLALFGADEEDELKRNFTREKKKNGG